MIKGIYKLNFKGTNRVYIGQSVDIQRRYIKHCSLMRWGFAPLKLQEAYNQYGMPTLEIILEDLSPYEMDIFEDEAIKLWDSCKNGFNTKDYATISGLGVQGELNGNAKYSNKEIVELMEFILDNPILTLKKVSEILDIGLVTVEEVAAGIKHKWLRSTYPEKYEQLMSLNGKRSKAKGSNARGIFYPPICSPEGLTYEVDNVRAFAREHGLNHSCLSKVLKNKQSQHKGWKLLVAS